MTVILCDVSSVSVARLSCITRSAGKINAVIRVNTVYISAANNRDYC